jgi:hypothetical protein
MFSEYELNSAGANYLVSARIFNLNFKRLNSGAIFYGSDIKETHAGHQAHRCKNYVPEFSFNFGAAAIELATSHRIVEICPRLPGTYMENRVLPLINTIIYIAGHSFAGSSHTQKRT